jgi:hypothetical protein
VVLDASRLELNRNHIGGALWCANETTIVAGEDGDATSNIVRGPTDC